MEKAEKRLGQITAQMDERIIRESYFANEKAVMCYIKSVVRVCLDAFIIRVIYSLTNCCPHATIIYFQE